MKKGSLQLIPLILVTLLAISAFVVSNSLQNISLEIRNRAQEIYPSANPSSLPNGEICTNDNQCLSGSCVTDTLGLRVCAFKSSPLPTFQPSPLLSINSICHNGSECASGYCASDSIGGLRYCAVKSSPAPILLPNGSLCTGASNCASGYCGHDTGDNTLVCAPQATPNLPVIEPSPANQPLTANPSPNYNPFPGVSPPAYQTVSPCVADPNSNACTQYKETQYQQNLKQALTPYEVENMKNCHDNPDNQQCKDYMNTIKVVGFGSLLGILGAPLAPVISTGALSAYSYVTATLTTAPAWVPSAINTALFGLGTLETVPAVVDNTKCLAGDSTACTSAQNQAMAMMTGFTTYAWNSVPVSAQQGSLAQKAVNKVNNYFGNSNYLDVEEYQTQFFNVFNQIDPNNVDQVDVINKIIGLQSGQELIPPRTNYTVMQGEQFYPQVSYENSQFINSLRPTAQKIADVALTKSNPSSYFYGNLSEYYSENLISDITPLEKELRNLLYGTAGGFNQTVSVDYGIKATGGTLLCSECAATLNYLGTEQGFPSQVVRAPNLERGAPGHAWLETWDNSGVWATDPLNLTNPPLVNKASAYDYYLHSLNLDTDSLTRLFLEQ